MRRELTSNIISGLLAVVWILGAAPAPADSPALYISAGSSSGQFNVECTSGKCSLASDNITNSIRTLDGKPVPSSAHFALAQAAHVDNGFTMTLERGDLPRGMFQVVTTVSSLGSTNRQFYIPTNATPASANVGQRFIALPDALGVGTDLQHTAVWDDAQNGSLFAAQHFTWLADRSSLVITNLHGATYSIPVAQVLTQADLIPIVEDENATALQNAYSGKLVWPRGGARLRCGYDPYGSAFYEVSPRLPLRLRTIVRAYRNAELTLGFDGAFGDATYVAIDPLIITFELTRTPDIWGSGYSDRHPAPGLSAHIWAIEKCRFLYSVKADVWDFMRSYSSASAASQHPDWSAATIRLINAGKISHGMTHDMVAWSLGYPAALGDRKELNRLSVWRYPHAPGFGEATVYFKNGKVISVNIDSIVR